MAKFMLLVFVILFQLPAVIAAQGSQPVLRWHEVRGANSYLVEILDSSGRSVMKETTKKNEIPVSLPAGTYRTRISPINKFNKPEQNSAWQQLIVHRSTRPVIEFVTPYSFSITQRNVPAEIHGSNFTSSSKIKLHSGSRTIELNGVRFSSPNRMLFTIDPSSIGEGLYSISVINLGGVTARRDNEVAVGQRFLTGRQRYPNRSHPVNQPLIEAVKAGNLNLVKSFVESGADPSSLDQSGFSCVHYAAASGNLQILQYLSEKGGDMYTKDPRGATPLHHACYAGRSAVVRFLVESIHSDINTRTSLGYAPLDRAAIKRNTSIVQYLIRKGAFIKYQINTGETPLHFACYSGDIASAEILLNADPSLLEIKENRGYTALHYAAWYGHIELIRYLRSAGADTAALSETGETPIELARKAGNTSVVDLLSAATTGSE